MAGSAADYSMVLATRGFAGLVRQAIQLDEILVADGTPAQAQLIRKALSTLERELNEIAARVSTLAHEEIVGHEVSSRVRPQATGELEDRIGQSHPLPAVPGAVGINDETELQTVSWWWTNEEGYSGHLGRTFIGAFEGTRPDPARFREHALLRVGKGPGTGKGTIKNPIPERRFVRDGARVAEVEWHREVQAAKRRFMQQVQFAVAESSRISRARTASGRRRRP